MTLSDRLAFSPAEVASLVGLSESHVRRLVKTGVLARVPYTGGRVLVSKWEIERWLNTPAQEDGAA